ncbi:MAG: hypothetical protein AAGC60_14535 [Acidobacteriota bacterium]
MPTFEVRGGKPVERSNLPKGLFGLKLSRNRFVLGDPVSGTEITTFEAYEKHLAEGANVYLVPGAAATPRVVSLPTPAGTPTRTLVATWTPRLLLEPPMLETRLLRLEDAVYRATGPRSRSVQRPAERVVVLVAEVDVPPRMAIDTSYSWRPAVHLFMGVEYYFNLRAGRDGGKTVVPCTVADRDRILTRLERLSHRTPGVVLIPGTIIWRDRFGRCWNTGYVFYDGELVESVDRRRSYDKFGVADYERRMLREFDWEGGRTPWFTFRHPTLQLICCLQICADHDCNPEGATPDLQLVCSTSFGRGGRPDTHEGGWCIYADGDGVWRRVRAQDRRAETGKNDLEVHDLVVYRR